MDDPSAKDRTNDVEELLDMEQSGRTWRSMAPKALAMAALVIGAALGVVLYSGQEGPDKTRFITEPVTRGELHMVVIATGSIQPTNKVDVSSELSGTIRRVFVDYNSPVRVGQPLAELDTDKLSATVDNSRAKLDAAKARMKVAEVTVWETERDFNRKQELSERRVSTMHELEISQALYRRAAASFESAKADVAVAEAELKLNETNLSKACICSPINGVVLSRNIDPGQTVASSFQAPVLFSIAEDLTQMEAQVDVDEADVGQVKVGQSATFTVDAYPDRIFPARIRELRLASEVVQGVVTYKALLAVDNPDLLLRPGMTATAQIAVHEVADAVLVPNAALRFAPPAEVSPQKTSLLRSIIPGMPRFRPASEKETVGPNRKVWTIRDGNAVDVPVTAGATDGKRTEILGGGLAPGDRVIVGMTTAAKP